MHKNILTVIGITILFLGVGIQPAIADDDTTPPVITHTLDPPTPNGLSGWYVSNVNVTLTATDDTSLEVIAKVFGIWRIYFIITIIKNIGDEIVKFVHCSPGGGFEIHNSEKRVYWVPKIPTRIGIGRTLYPGQSAIMYWSFWTGFDDFGRKLPNGEYYVRGFVWTNEFGTLYGENVSIFLGKSLNN